MTASAETGGVVPLFATPFAVVNTGTPREFNARVASLCESRPAADNLFAASEPVAGELERLLLGRASAVIASLASQDAAEFAKRRNQARGWCSILPRGGHVPSQHFSNASWLAIYCVQAGEPEAGSRSAGVLRLYERRLGSIYRDAGNHALRMPYRYGNHAWTPVPGWMALFPAHVPHEVSVVRSAVPLILVFALIRFAAE